MSSEIKTTAEKIKDQGNVLVHKKRYAEAIGKYKEPIELDPNVPAYHSNLSHCYNCLMRYREVEVSARRVIRLNPENKALLVKGYWRLAVALLRQNEESSGGDHTGDCLIQHENQLKCQNRYREAAEILRLAKEIQPNSGEAIVVDLATVEAKCQTLGIHPNSDGNWYDFNRDFDTDDECGNFNEDDDSYDNQNIDVPPKMVDRWDYFSDESELPPLHDKADIDNSSNESMPSLHDHFDSDCSSDDSDSDLDGIPCLNSPREAVSDSDSHDCYHERRRRAQLFREQERKRNVDAKKKERKARAVAERSEKDVFVWGHSVARDCIFNVFFGILRSDDYFLYKPVE